MTIIKIHPKKFQSDDLQVAVSSLRKGGVIAYPTETVYGLGANIYQQKAVLRIFEIKGRDISKPVSIMIASDADVNDICMDIPDYSRTLMAKYWPGPLTLIFKASEELPEYIVSEDKKIGLRLPDHPITRKLMELHSEPMTSTSANISGEQAPIHAQEVANTFKERIDVIIDGGECEGKVPSTVLDASGNTPRILREGAISSSQIEQSLEGVKVMTSKTFNILFVCSGNSCRSPMAEGMLKSKLSSEFQENVAVKSAGTLGLDGNTATDFAVKVAKDFGADISEHRSHGITEELVKEADIIFAMAPEHKIFLQNHYPEFRENVFLLKSFARNPDEKFNDRIEDPIGGSLRVYQKCGEIIDSELERVLPRLKQLIQEKLGNES
ncbi:threonylcarbamoyl-AMP synthase [candidate division KSB1 bacterium]|nr:threonylcarbamoyl-AMP synthase [candidate division KSB1 bacterium]NIS28242.1 threonylcarbamoyl-AMP synthase [candidate division KSB1 bacterium]NIT75131.1 threonylcarbamoyl-AMP synthase [candidate division KSB1 bacterium]NIU28919.1 threonylcarbamoyl-AMP synthase [candidate division KSB1 bacterium]NIU90896.1 threonylcarbamoyl-AMP synthase [candidate division KSB1 bacterium]